MNIDDDVNLLCSQFQYNTTVYWKPKRSFKNDFDCIIEAIILYQHSLIDLDIYELLVSVGNNLTWDAEYSIDKQNLNWLKNEGKLYFFNNITSNRILASYDEYNSLEIIFNKLCELFELQLE
jgi:hypothetical protein